MKMFFLNVAGATFLLLAGIHVAGYAFGWTKFRQEDWVPLIIGGICGGVGAAVVNARKSRAARDGHR